jgi:hypothetical protein
MDRMQATPRSPFLGGLADLLKSSYSPERTQQMQGLMNFMSVPAVARTVDRLSYGEPLTTGTGMTTAPAPRHQRNDCRPLRSSANRPCCRACSRGHWPRP